MKSPRPLFIRNLALAFFIGFGGSIITSFGLELYQTDFDAFPAGAGAWAGTDNWATTGASSASFGISDTVLPDLNNTAYIGFGQPNSALTIVYRQFDMDPVATGQPIIQIQTLIGVQDSNNGQRDQFFIGLRDRSGGFLAGIGLDNRGDDNSVSNLITRLDGVNEFATLESFDRNELHLLYLEINFAANTWTAELDGVFPIFTDAPFSNSGNPLDFGFLSYEWQLSANQVDLHGNNFLLVGDLVVDAAPIGLPLALTVAQSNPSQCLFSWVAQPGFQYELEFADGLDGAFQKFPNLVFADITSTQTLSHARTPPAASQRRFYRVRRTAQP